MEITAQGLRVVRASSVPWAVEAMGAVPWFVRGLWETPPLPQWPQWGVSAVRVLASPTGTFGAYADCESDGVPDPRKSSGISFTSQRCRRDEACEPKHYVKEATIDEAIQAFADPGSLGASHVYVRAVAGDEMRQRAGESVGSRLRNLAPYLSSAGSVTNLHWDAAAGILAQTEGEKDVSLFPAQTMPSESKRDSPCYRRSYESGRECPAGSTYRLRLLPGWGIFIPAFWAHHVVSLSPGTLGAVWRFEK